MTTIKWNVDSDGDWSDTTNNWSPKQFPNSSSDVTINTTDLHTITYSNGTTATVHSLTVGNDNFTVTAGSLTITTTASFANAFEQDGGTIIGTGTLTMNGATTLAGGNQHGTGTTLLNGPTTISGEVAFDGGRVLENKGTLTWADGEIDLGYTSGGNIGNATLKNDAGATFDIQSDNEIYNGKGANTLVNAGTLEKTDTTGTTEIDVALTNTGTVSVHTGTLLLDGGGSSAAGAITAASGTTIAFGGGTFTLGAGTIGGKGLVSVKGGKLELGSGSVNVTSFEQDYGTVDGSGTLTVKGVANFDGPVYQSGTGKTLLQGATTISDNVALDGGRVLENQKTLTWSDGAISLGYNPSSTNIGNATIKNDSGATFNIQSDRTIYKEKGTTSFVNAGTLEKTNSTGTTYIEVPFINTGTVSVHTGTLQFDNAMTGSGSFTVSSGAALILDASATTAANTIYIASGGGSVSLTGGSGSDTFKFAGNLAKSSTLDGGGGTNTVVLNGDYTGSHALVFGATTMVNVQKLTLSAGHSYNLKTNDATVAAGQKLTVDASTLGATDSLTFNGSAETDGKFVIIGGAGIDTLTGGKGADTITGGSGADKITGGGGADSLTGGAGADTFIYKAASDSTSTKYDTITGFDATSDKIDTWFKVTGVNTALTTGALNSGTNFNANLKTAIGSHLTAHHAIEFTPNSGSLAGQHFLIVDVNGTAGYQAGSDLVINLVSPTHMTSLAVGTFT